MNFAEPLKKLFETLVGLSQKSSGLLRVLVVDDNPTDLFLIEQAVLRVIDKTQRTEAANVDTAPGGEEAYSMLNTGEYDVVVTDQLLPGGVTSRDIERFAKRRDIPVFTVSAEPDLFYRKDVINKLDLYTV